MKTFRYIGMALMAILLSVSLVACGDDEEEELDGSTFPTEKIGLWEMTWEAGYYIEDGESVSFDHPTAGTLIYFENDGTGYTYNEGDSESEVGYFDWGIKGDKLIIKYADIIETVRIISLSTTSMKIEDKGSDYSYIHTFTKKEQH